MIELRGILFDKDGTLFDFASTWEAWAAAFLMRLAKDVSHAMYLGQAIGFDYSSKQFARDSIVIAGTPDQVAEKILKAWRKGSDVIYAPGFWRLIMFIITSIPEKIFKRLSL